MVEAVGLAGKVFCEGNAVGTSFKDPHIFLCNWILQPDLGRGLLESILQCMIVARAQGRLVSVSLLASAPRSQYGQSVGRSQVEGGPLLHPPVDTLGLAFGRRCGFGRVGASGQDPCLLEVALPEGGGVGSLEPGVVLCKCSRNTFFASVVQVKPSDPASKTRMFFHVMSHTRCTRVSP